jgi:hypothetical protein
LYLLFGRRAEKKVVRFHKNILRSVSGRRLSADESAEKDGDLTPESKNSALESGDFASGAEIYSPNTPQEK